MATAETNSLPWGLLDRMPRILLDHTPDGTTKACGNQVTRPESIRYNPLTISPRTKTPVDVGGVSQADS